MDRALERRSVLSECGPGLLSGARDSLSMVFGLTPVGIAFGIAAKAYGLTTAEACLMSLLVFAGASQFIGIAMIAAGAGVMEVAITTFFVNLRYAMMSTSLAVHLRGVGRGMLALLAFHLTDESYGLSIVRFDRGEGDHWYLLAVNFAIYVVWNTSTLAGHLLGEVLPPLLRDAFAFAVPAVFLSLMVMACRDRTSVVVALFSSALSVALYLAHVDFGNVILVCLAGATLGVVLERWKGK